MADKKPERKSPQTEEDYIDYFKMRLSENSPNQSQALLKAMMPYIKNEAEYAAKRNSPIGWEAEQNILSAIRKKGREDLALSQKIGEELKLRRADSDRHEKEYPERVPQVREKVMPELTEFAAALKKKILLQIEHGDYSEVVGNQRFMGPTEAHRPTGTSEAEHQHGVNAYVRHSGKKLDNSVPPGIKSPYVREYYENLSKKEYPPVEADAKRPDDARYVEEMKALNKEIAGLQKQLDARIKQEVVDNSYFASDPKLGKMYNQEKYIQDLQYQYQAEVVSAATMEAVKETGEKKDWVFAYSMMSRDTLYHLEKQRKENGAIAEMLPPVHPENSEGANLILKNMNGESSFNVNEAQLMNLNADPTRAKNIGPGNSRNPR